MIDPSLLTGLDNTPSWGIALPLLIGGGAALLRGIGGLFGNRSKSKKEDAAARETQRSNVDTHNQREQRRLAILRTIQGQAGSRGIDFPIDPSLMEARPYTGADPTKVTSAGRGSGLAASILGGLGEFGGDVAQAGQLKGLLSPGQPVGAGGAGVPGLDEDTLSQIALEAGVSTEDVKELVNEILAERMGGGNSVPLGGKAPPPVQVRG